MSEFLCSQRILVVDDDPMVRDVLADHFDIEGCPNAVADNGESALKMLKENDFTIVVTDLMMPQMDGLTLIKAIRRQWPDIDIIAVTGFQHDFSYTEVIYAGASDFICKPFSLNELDAKINRILRERNLRKKLLELSIRDDLTGIYNRRFFDDRIDEEVIRSERQGYPLFLMIIDLDKFKRVNDEEGHQVGDRLLRTFADILKQSTREHVDLVCRYGGDEFAVIVPQATEKQALVIAKRMIKRFMNAENFGTSLSIGIAALFQDEHESPEKKVQKLVREADDAMYLSKKRGGNRITIYGNEQ